MIKTKYHKGYSITIEKTKKGMLTLKNNGFKFRYVFYTEKDALNNFIKILKSYK